MIDRSDQGHLLRIAFSDRRGGNARWRSRSYFQTKGTGPKRPGFAKPRRASAVASRLSDRCPARNPVAGVVIVENSLKDVGQPERPACPHPPFSSSLWRAPSPERRSRASSPSYTSPVCIATSQNGLHTSLFR